jgi:hypothetical protein
MASCSEHFISIKHRILATFKISKKNQFEQLYAFKRNDGLEIVLMLTMKCVIQLQTQKVIKIVH